MSKPILDQHDRALELGVSTELHPSFDMNQSCPPFGKVKQSQKLQSSLKQFIKFTGDEFNACCYSGVSNESLLPDFGKSLIEPDSARSYNSSRPVSSLSFNASWSSLSETTNSMVERSNFNFKALNKAVLTVDAKTSQILTANKQACVLFEHTSDSIVSLKLTELFKKFYKSSEHKKALLHDVCEEQGKITVFSGKVKEIVTKSGREIPVSVWMRKFEGAEGRSLCVCMLQSVSRITGNFTFNPEGDIITCDDDFSRVHGHPSTTSLEGVNLRKLMPSYDIPLFGSRLAKNIRKQHTTSTTVDGQKIPVSVYLKSQENNGKSGKLFSAVLWYFHSISGPLTTDDAGVIQNVNSNFAMSLFGYSSDQLKNKNISVLLPGLTDEGMSKLNMDLHSVSEESDALASKLPDKKIFPNSPHEVATSDSTTSFVNISMPNTTSDPSSPSSTALERINSLLLGRSTPQSKNDVSSKLSQVADCPYGQRLVDGSWVEVSMNPSPTFEHATEDSGKFSKVNLALNGSTDLLEGDKEEIPTDSHVSSNNLSASQHVGELDSQSGESNASTNEKREVDCDRSASLSDDKENANSDRSRSLNSEKLLRRSKHPHPLIASANATSTPMDQEKRKPRTRSVLNEGHFEGHALHKDGSLIAVCYEVRLIQPCNMVCVWISLASDRTRCNSSSGSNQTLYSSFNSTLPSLNASFAGADHSLGSAIKQASQKHDESAFSPVEGTDEWLAVQGRFSERYDINRAIGSGAFGFVRVAHQKKTNKKFIVKFIRKEKVLEECWIDDYESDSVIPLEIFLLAKFNHPNIVKVVEFFENDHFFSMLMPTHGLNGIDLFEFIDREPALNELLASYIFRQIASAVHFLHQEGVVHRDIKDENVIIDETFTCKLIDFGSAAFYKKGKTFGTFCGTVEYCSPEVLMGARYEGPALESWALGVTLYTLVYGENPFRDIDETIEAKLQPPHFLSPELMSLVRNLLQPVPEHRYTIEQVVEHVWVNVPVDISMYSWDNIVPPAGQKSFQDASSQYQLNLPADDTCDFADDSLVSSRETLATHLRKWNQDREGLLEAEWNASRDCKHKLPPLSRRLENINLNHSV